MTVGGSLRRFSPVSLRGPTCRHEAISGSGDGIATPRLHRDDEAIPWRRLGLPRPDFNLSGVKILRAEGSGLGMTRSKGATVPEARKAGY